jgi:hypothetical protein
MTIRSIITAAVCLAVSATLAGQDKEKKDASAMPKKGDAVVLKGCLKGGALETAEVVEEDSSAPALSGLTFRLTGKKGVLKEMKEKHEGRVVEVRGTLKSDLEPHSGYGANLGRMHVTIGGPAPGSGARDAQPPRSLPVVDVSAFDGTGTGCSR